MKTLPGLVLACATGLLVPLWRNSQPTSQDKPAPPKKTEASPRKWLWGTEEEAKRIREGLLGAWQLTSVRRPGSTVEGEACTGYMLVTPEHLSMQARIRAPRDFFGDLEAGGFSAGTYRWSYDLPRLKVVIHTAMAVSNIGGFLSWEQPGSQREYDLVLNENLLTLNRPGEVEFNYMRIQPTPEPKRPEPR